jgi:hypothetical protein
VQQLEAKQAGNEELVKKIQGELETQSGEVDKLFKTKADVGDVSVKAEQKAVDGVFNNVKNLENFMKQVSERAVEVLARRGELLFCASEHAGTARRARGPQHAAPSKCLPDAGSCFSALASALERRGALAVHSTPRRATSITPFCLL